MIISAVALVLVSFFHLTNTVVHVSWHNYNITEDLPCLIFYYIRMYCLEKWISLKRYLQILLLIWQYLNHSAQYLLFSHDHSKTFVVWCVNLEPTVCLGFILFFCTYISSLERIIFTVKNISFRLKIFLETTHQETTLSNVNLYIT